MNRELFLNSAVRMGDYEMDSRRISKDRDKQRIGCDAVWIKRDQFDCALIGDYLVRRQFAVEKQSLGIGLDQFPGISLQGSAPNR